jgi:type IV pilus assembly protein PilY1
MKLPLARTLCAGAIAATVLTTSPALAEDIDLFTGVSGSGGPAPNILIILDNSANWNRNDQAWPSGKQGQSELAALSQLMDDPNVNANVNIGLMMFTSAGSPTGAYVRYSIRGMTPTNKAAFKEMIGTSACTAGPNSLMGTPNCILANFSSSTEETNSAATIYETAYFEAFKYFGGYTDPAHASTDSTPTPYPVDSTHFGPRRYSGLDSKADPFAFTDAGKTTYKGPINADGSNSCARNYVVFIGNGYPSQVLAPSILTGINGNATVPPPIGNKSNISANWARYVFTTDVNQVLGRQYINTYTLDAYLAHQDLVQTSLLRGMAKFGGGRYFAVHSQNDILNALKDILTEIQSVNSVFASASLPINATNRSQNANQVYIGMFRPDPKALPRWYGNLKQYQIALFGTDAKLADKNGLEAISASTGFVQSCATSFWTTDSGTYWSFSPPSAGSCTTVLNSTNSDLPDGGVVEKGGVAEVVRRGNDPSAVAPFAVNRTMYTETASFGSLVSFNSTNVPMARTGALTSAENQSIIDYTFGKDVNDENLDLNVTEPRASIHGDIAHSRPLPVNFGGARGVVVYYGGNDGPYRALDGTTGKELWTFVAPEHHAKLRRLFLNDPMITYPNLPIGVTSARKDYFFDGATGLYQNADNSKVWIFPTMRRGGRMLYAFDVTSTTPALKWSIGCPNLADDTGCSAGTSGMGQTWSSANVDFIKSVNNGQDPIIVMGGGYDSCEDTDNATTTCSVGTEKGAHVYVINAATGAILQTFNTDRAVPGDVTLVDRDFDGAADHAYVGDTGGNIYRIDFVDPVSLAPVSAGSWTISKIASTSGGARKFLFGPSALALANEVILALGSGDRERPLITNYPYTSPVQNRFYVFIDKFTGTTENLDGANMANFTSATDCSTALSAGQVGWFMDLNAGVGEQTVTSSVIFGGTVFWSTNRPVPVTNSCATNLGEARGYAVNLLNASGVVGSGALCGGSRSGVFTGGGLPPSPVIGIVPVSLASGGTKPITVLIGGINLQTGTGSPIGAQQPPIPIKKTRNRIYWYPQGDK